MHHGEPATKDRQDRRAGVARSLRRGAICIPLLNPAAFNIPLPAPLFGALVLLLTLLLIAPAGAQATERRVALVIGNASYAQRPLRNPVNDAEDLGATLRALGFEVLLRKNRNAEEIKQDLADFQDRLEHGRGVGLFYFSGHGMQAGKGRNYLLPVGREYKRERDVELFGVDAGAVLARMEEAGNPLNIVILDACRDSPLPAEAKSAASRGLGRMEAPSGSLIAFATAPGSIADDNTAGRNGLYTKHLLRAIATPGLCLEDVFKQVGREVERKSNRRQSPEKIAKLRDATPFYFTLKEGAGEDASSVGSAGSPEPPVAADMKPVARPEARFEPNAVAGIDRGATEPRPEPSSAGGSVNWTWPATGKVVSSFNDSTSKGIDIGGKLGDPVLAAAAGKLLYAGQDLRGYGNLVVLKHSNQYLSVYAHNSKILVKEGQEVHGGQKIAELGKSDTSGPKLHFEIRRQGKPENPLQYLPSR